MAVLAAVIRGFARRGGAALGNFWQDLTRTLLYILLPLSIVGALFLVSQGVVQTLGGYVTYTTLTGGEQTLALGPGRLAGSRSSSSAPTAAASSTSTPRCRSRTRRGFSNFVEVLFILLIPAALTATFGRMVGNRRQGWALYAAMAVDVRRRRRDRLRRRAERLAGTDAAESRRPPTARPAATSRARSSASGSPTARCGRPSRPSPRAASVNSALDSYTGIGGAVPLVEHDDRRGHLRRRRLGPLRDAAVRPARGVHRRPDGRPHARVPRQEDRGARDQARRSIGTLCRAAARCSSSTALAVATKYGRAVDLQRRARRASPRRSTPTPRRATTTARRSPATPASCSRTRPATTGAFGITFADLLGGARDAARPLRAAARGARRRRRRSPASASRPPARARCAPTRRRSSSC